MKIAGRIYVSRLIGKQGDAVMNFTECEVLCVHRWELIHVREFAKYLGSIVSPPGPAYFFEVFMQQRAKAIRVTARFSAVQLLFQTLQYLKELEIYHACGHCQCKSSTILRQSQLIPLGRSHMS